MPEVSPFLAVCVGNSRTRFGVFRGKELDEGVSLPNAGFDSLIAGILSGVRDDASLPVVMADVNPAVAERIEGALGGEHGHEVLRFGRDIHVPLRHALDDASTLGMDRALCAYGAYARAKQACVIVDAGTAITVDFVDGEGTFQGGVIAPGLRMMLGALHEKTAGLPQVELVMPDESGGPFGRDTRGAMLRGVINAARGLVRHTVERFALHYEAYPQIVATGGDAVLLFESDDVVEHIIPDLQLIGVMEAVRSGAAESE